MDPRHRLALTDASDDRPGPWQAAPSVAANKVARFAGTTRKSKFELEREAEQQREKAAKDDAARAYDEFVEAFGGDEEVGPSRGGRARGGGTGRSKGKGFVRAGGDEKYDPLAGRPQPPPPPPPAPAPAPAPPASGSRTALQPQAAAFVPKNQPRATAASLMADDDESQAQAPVVPGRKKRAGDTFLEQLKRDQAAREERLKQAAGRVGSSVTALAAREHAPVLTGSYDVGDPLTTNLHVGGLPTNVTEQSFGKLFAQFGPVGSVKIMWPRLDSGQLAAMGGRKLGGFVAFLRRPDAERAAKEMDGAEWGGNTLKIGWGKAVPIPATAIYEPDYDARSSHRARSRSLSPNLDPHEFLRAKAASGPSSSSASKRARPRSRSPQRTRAWPQLEDGVDEPFLVAVAKRVRDNGRQFEEVLKDKERDNARFAFLRDDKLPSYHYFRMLVDPTYEPPLVASFDDEGKASIYSSDSSEYSEDDRVGKGHLGPLAERRFTSLLRGLTSSRDKIARGMSFALEHADCASYIADLLVCSLTIDTTPVPRKLARLHLVSDILHNSAASVPNAWTYRSILERKLPAVFDHLGDIYLSFPGRLKAEQFRGLVEKVLDVWANDWIVFEPSIIDDFKRRLAGLDVLPPSSSALPLVDSAPSANLAMHTEPIVGHEPTPAPAPPSDDLAAAAASTTAEPASRAFKPSFKAATFAPAEPGPDADADVDGAPVEGAGTVDEDDVDGAPVELELDGAPLDEDVDGAPVAAAAGDEEDVDGAPLTVAQGRARRETETLVLDGEGDETMETGSDDNIFR